MTEFTDEYFINLTMKYDERDDEVYPKWAVWCAKSDDKYYIDGKDGHFFTHVRTEEEIAIERKMRELNNFVMEERFKANITPDSSEEDREMFRKYEEQYRHPHDEKSILDITPISFEDWKKTLEESK